jgi:asparagine synthase (glutamine-hydrolysing)
MTDALAHRGPDGEGLWVDEDAGVALGHRRLAIIDLSVAAGQPMLSGSGRYAITYNGEIYNYRELRAELEMAGVRFRSQSDPEVLVEACAAWGVAATAKRLNGIFAFALWDAQERILFLVRDYLGVKPLYWTESAGNFLFGSELRALARHPRWHAEIDRNALAAYFRHNYIPAPGTIYSGVFKLPPGSMLTLRRDRAPELLLYSDMEDLAAAGLRSAFSGPDSEAVTMLDGLLREAVRRQMMSDVPLGAFLSGGIDSSTVVALMQSQSTRPIKTFTIGFHETGYDEAHHARAVAEHIGSDHAELYVAPEDARALIPSIADWFDEPFADVSQIPTFLVAQLARRQVTVALSGDGGDELFAGYNRYTLAQAWERRVRLVPRTARRATAAGIKLLSPSFWDGLLGPIPSAWRPVQVGDKLHKLASVIRLDSEDAIYRRLVSQWERPAEVVVGGIEPLGVLWHDRIACNVPNFLARMQLLDMLTYLPDDILTKVDRTSMAVSLEARVPLLDPTVVAFAWRLPPHLKLRGGKSKWLLRQVLHRYIPAALVERPKMGFGVPIDSWLRGPLRDWAEGLLDERRLRIDGFLDAAVVRQKWAEHLSGRRNRQYALWGVLMFQEWKRRWFDGATVGSSTDRRERLSSDGRAMR